MRGREGSRDPSPSRTLSYQLKIGLRFALALVTHALRSSALASPRRHQLRRDGRRGWEGSLGVPRSYFARVGLMSRSLSLDLLW